MRNSGFELQFFQSSNRLRAKTEVMEEISSQNSDLGLEDLDKLEAKGQAENTVTSMDIFKVNFVICLLFIDDFKHFFGNFQ